MNKMKLKDYIKIERQDNRLVGKFVLDVQLGMFISADENEETLKRILENDIEVEVIKHATEIIAGESIKDKLTGFSICDDNYLGNEEILIIVNKNKHVDMLKNAMKCGLLPN